MTDELPGEIPGLSPEQMATLREGGTVTVNPHVFRGEHGPELVSLPTGARVERAVDHSPRETR